MIYLHDNRGIDVGLIYNQDYFEVIREKNIKLELINNDDSSQIFTRDQHLVEGLLSGYKIYIIINHLTIKHKLRASIK